MASVPTASVAEGRVRAVIDAVLPTVDGGRFPAKRIAGEVVGIEAHCFTDGHDRVRAVLRWKLKDSAGAHIEVDMKAQSNDVWTAEMTPPQPGLYQCTVIAWVDHFESWRREFERREDRSDIRLAVETGAALIDEAATRAAGSDAAILSEWSSQLRDSLKETGAEVTALRALALDPARASVVARHTDRSLAASATMDLLVDRKRAAFSSWYELFPRSAAALSGLHGKFSDVEARLPYLAEMGFDVLYFPPIHPIGRVNRKGTNNALRAKPGDVGSPWAIGAAEGGHKDILPQLGTFDDFDRLLNVARELGIEIAMDIAFQCAPDHPYVSPAPAMVQASARRQRAIRRESSEEIPGHLSVRFRKQRLARPVGRTQERHRLLDRATACEIFRVDNPHTKAFAFWEWLIGEIKREHPDVIFLAEAFTRPKVMHRLAKLGFTQSYTYFTWRNTKQELTDYFTELEPRVRAGNTSGPTYGPIRPTSCTRPCSRACAPCLRRG